MSAPTPGVFTCADLQVLQTRAQNVWQGGGSNLQTNYMPESDAAKQMLSTQTARFEALKDPSKDRTMKVYWTEVCPKDSDDCPTDYCSIDGVEGGASCVEYEIDQCVSVEGYTVKERMFRSSELTFDEVLAPGYTQMILSVENQLSRKVLDFLCDNAGVNQDTLGPWTISGDTTYIPATGWNPQMMAFLEVALRMNRLSAGNLLATQFLMAQWLNYQASVTNPDGQANLRMMGRFGQPTFDLFQMAQALGTCEGTSTAQGMFLYSPNSSALVTKSEFLEYGAQGRIINGSNGQYTRRYSVRGLNLPIDIDMIYQVECQGKDIVHTWKPFINYGLFLNPIGCNTDTTGILKFICGTGS